MPFIKTPNNFDEIPEWAHGYDVVWEDGLKIVYSSFDKGDYPPSFWAPLSQPPKVPGVYRVLRIDHKFEEGIMRHCYSKWNGKHWCQYFVDCDTSYDGKYNNSQSALLNEYMDKQFWSIIPEEEKDAAAHDIPDLPDLPDPGPWTAMTYPPSNHGVYRVWCIKSKNLKYSRWDGKWLLLSKTAKGAESASAPSSAIEVNPANYAWSFLQSEDDKVPEAQGTYLIKQADKGKAEEELVESLKEALKWIDVNQKNMLGEDPAGGNSATICEKAVKLLHRLGYTYE